MANDFLQRDWDLELEDDLRQLIRLGIREDLRHEHDWTTLAVIPADATGKASVVARDTGVIAGLKTIDVILDETNVAGSCSIQCADGQTVTSGQAIVVIEASARELLTIERLILNFIGRLSGIATLTAQYVSHVEGRCRVYDTRKTTPGWRRLEKYAVRCGGGMNHRIGLHDAIMIKDNHLAISNSASVDLTMRQAIEMARNTAASIERDQDVIVEVEVDTLEQLTDVIPAEPDIVLLDNMTVEELQQAVAMIRDTNSGIELEASGGVTLETIGEISQSGVDRISVGALTHSAVNFDVGLDWSFRP
ncbi:MAG TPA: carboxylating nicotinate-nucleotide diphosphorylase [Planctomycetaceae bacterium]|nr:carboxylating nicotinate-nucleotide diphosphorylase [Planctomycetaceae bacterium]|tara:strand:+ start:292 stop:1209 length:918 start_codon:yes stop_codon:yes gene_type:complete